MTEKITMTSTEEIGLITIDDGKANAMDDDFFDQLNIALDQVEKLLPKALLVKGRKGFFSAGLNLNYVMSLPKDEIIRFNIGFADTILRLLNFPIPTIAVCTGHAIAGGAMLAMACDLRFAPEGEFKFQVNEVLLGIPVPAWMQLIARTCIPADHFRESVLHARAYKPKEAVEAGIYTGLIDSDKDCLDELQTVIAGLSGLNQLAYSRTKDLLFGEKISAVRESLKEELQILIG